MVLTNRYRALVFTNNGMLRAQILAGISQCRQQASEVTLPETATAVESTSCYVVTVHG